MTGGTVLDLDPNRVAVTPKDAATVAIVRDGDAGVEIFCVERSKQSRFMGGAIVFPGGKLDPADGDAAWSSLATEPRPIVDGRAKESFATDPAHHRALAVAACRETLEEAAILLSTGSATHEEALALRSALTGDPLALRDFLARRGHTLDLTSLRPFGRWITPVAEPRRFDARFFVVAAPPGMTGAHDDHETMASFWATPARILERAAVGEVTVMPPTHRTLELFRDCASVDAVFRLVDALPLDPICPRLVKHIDAQGETLALVLPGDPDHDVREVRVPGPSRYVLRDGQWRSENAP